MKKLSKKLSLDELKESADMVLDKNDLASVTGGRHCYYKTDCYLDGSYVGQGCPNNCWPDYLPTVACEATYGPGAVGVNCYI